MIAPSIAERVGGRFVFRGQNWLIAPALACVLLTLGAVGRGQSETGSNANAAPTPQASSAATPATEDVFSPDSLPGRGLDQHPFLYAGETERRRPEQTMSVVRGGKVVWTYTMPGRNAAGHAQEFSDAWMLSNGNILFSRETGAMEVTPEKKVIWNYDAPPGCEVHAVQPVDKQRIFIMQNGTPARAMIVDTTTGKVEKETAIPAASPAHSQFRHARYTAAGTILAAHLNEGRVAEYDWTGKEIWSVAAPGVWAATRLKNGNTLISLEHTGVREVDPKGKTVWEFTQADVPDIKLVSMQEASRLANGNTLICNWASGRVPLTEWPREVQLLEVTPAKKVVWALRAWSGKADLGPATSVQLLDEPGVAERPGDLQR
jgi:hypothetical protein